PAQAHRRQDPRSWRHPHVADPAPDRGDPRRLRRADLVAVPARPDRRPDLGRGQGHGQRLVAQPPRARCPRAADARATLPTTHPPPSPPAPLHPPPPPPPPANGHGPAPFAPGPVTVAGDALTGTVIPPDHAAVQSRIASYVPETDADLVAFILGEAAAQRGYS